MPMKRVNIQFEDQTYKKIKAVSFIEDKSFAEVVREGMALYLHSKKNIDKKLQDALEVDDDTFNKAMEDSFEQFDSVYKKLAQ